MKRISSFFLMLLAVSLMLPAGAQTTDVIGTLLKNGGAFTFGSRRGTGYVLAETGTHTVKGQTGKADAASGQWVVEPYSNGYTLRNIGSGRYLQATDGVNKTYTTGAGKATFFIKASPKSSTAHPRVIISTTGDYSDYTCLHDDASHNVVNWNANNSSDANPCSDWEVKAVEGLDLEAVRTHFEEVGHLCAPADGQYVRIRNGVTGMYIAERPDDNGLTCAYDDSTNLAQCWKVTAASGGKFTLQNARTLRYMAVSGQNGYLFTTLTQKPLITIAEVSSTWERHYNITCGGVCFYNSGGNNIINGNTTDARCKWLFVKSSLTEEQIREEQGDYALYADLSANQTKYSLAFMKFFTDGSCSELQDNYKQMSDAELTAAVAAAGLPEYLQKVALRVKNADWAPYEQSFRVASYGPYSKGDSWAAVNNPKTTGTSYTYGRLSNPTGIVAHAGDMLVVFCDRAAPSGATLQLEAVQGTAYSGTTYTLKKGMNVFTFANDVLTYVYYQLNSITRNLSDFPLVNVHIEGGAVNGCFDLTRGHTNADWQYMVANMLKESPVLNLKTPNLVFAFNADAVKKACPSDMEGVLAVWDGTIGLDRELLGFNNQYIPNIEERFNNIYNCFSGDDAYTGYMHATNYGGYFNDTTLPTIMNLEQLQQGGVWGPSHEIGHLHQALFNLVGSTEASNNMFANAYVYHQGRTTERAAAPQTLFDAFAKGTSWYDQDIWTMTKLYYQLYLHYVVQENCPTFFPQLFAKFREDGLDRHSATPSVIRGTGDCLKFARYCCEVAQEDLTELFQAYGFFVPCTDRAVSDYGQYTVNTTQADIDETLAALRQYPRKMGNLLFLDDRIKPVPATYEGHKAGETKKRRSDDQVGEGVSAGDYGQYTDYISGYTRDTYRPKADGYYYNVTSGGKITIRGTGAEGLVGIKVYDEAGKLSYLANKTSFTLPAALRKQAYSVVAAMGDGTDIQLGLNEPLPAAINAPETATQPSEGGILLDLQGRRLAPNRQQAHGLFLQNGRKVLR